MKPTQVDPIVVGIIYTLVLAAGLYFSRKVFGEEPGLNPLKWSWRGQSRLVAIALLAAAFALKPAIQYCSGEIPVTWWLDMLAELVKVVCGTTATALFGKSYGTDKPRRSG